MNIFSRLYGKIIKHFLEQEFSQTETEEQAGFRAGRSTVNHTFCLRQLIEKKMAVNQPLHLLYVDFEKAYDSMQLKNLWKALEHYNISNSIIRAIKRLYENSFSKIKIGKQLSSKYIFRMLWKIGRRNVQRWDCRFSI